MRRALTCSILHERLGVILAALKEATKVEALTKTSDCLSFEQLEDYVEGVYAGEALEEVFDHITSCSYCRRMATEMRTALEERAAPGTACS